MDKPRRIEAEDCAYTIGPFEAYDADEVDVWIERVKVERYNEGWVDGVAQEYERLREIVLPLLRLVQSTGRLQTVVDGEIIDRLDDIVKQLEETHG